MQTNSPNKMYVSPTFFWSDILGRPVTSVFYTTEINVWSRICATMVKFGGIRYPLQPCKSVSGNVSRQIGIVIDEPLRPFLWGKLFRASVKL